MDFDDLTTFDAQDRNNWIDGEGAVDAKIETEGKNSFWSGKMEARNIFTFKPGLRKKFNIDPAMQRELFQVSYRYRLKQQHSRYFQIATTTENHDVWAGTLVLPGTPTGEWRDSDPLPYYSFSSTKELLIGLRYVNEEDAGKLFEVDIDDIRVKMVT